MASATTRREFSSSDLQEFLQHGWFFSLPSGQILLGWGKAQASADPAMEWDQVSLFVPDFYLQTSTPWRVSPKWDLLDRDQFTSIVFSVDSSVVNGQELNLPWVEPEKENFLEVIERIQSDMRRGKLVKAVPVVFAKAKFQVDHSLKLYMLRRLSQLPNALRGYGYWQREDNEEFGLMGASPEVLFRIEEGLTLHTMALAGTYRKQGLSGEEERFLMDPKERREHQIVVDDIANALHEIGEVIFGPTEVSEWPTLYHLLTRLRVDLRAPPIPSLQDLVVRLHPTPALGIAPRSLGLKAVSQFDQHVNRGIFGAPFGVFHPGSMQTKSLCECLVAIRNVQWAGGEVRLGSGCGIVSASDPDQEWNELQLKRDSVRKALGV